MSAAAMPNSEPALRAITSLRSHPYRGVLVAVEGSDGAGKTTLIRRLERRLVADGRDVQLTRLPTLELRRTRLFRAWVREGHREYVSLLALQVMHMADRIQHTHEVIEPALRNGAVVLADRYIVSGLAAIIGRIERTDWAADLVRELVRPDVGVYLTAPWEERLRRVRCRANERRAEVRPENKSTALSESIANALGIRQIDTMRRTREEVTAEVLCAIRDQIARKAPSGHA